MAYPFTEKFCEIHWGMDCFSHLHLSGRKRQFYGHTRAFILKTRANFLIFALATAVFIGHAPAETGGRDPELGEGWERPAVFTPPPPTTSTHPSTLTRSPFCGNFSIGFTSEKAHSLPLNDHRSLLRETRQGACVKSIIISVGKLSY